MNYGQLRRMKPHGDDRGATPRSQAPEGQAEMGGGQNKLMLNMEKGKMTARERIEAFLDDGTFQEIDALVEHRCTDFGMDTKYNPLETSCLWIWNY